MLPPLTIAMSGPDPLTRPASAAATVAAPDGSATTLAFVNSQRTASMICSSSTVITSSTYFCACAKVRSPGRTGIKPSATLAVLSSVTA